MQSDGIVAPNFTYPRTSLGADFGPRPSRRSAITVSVVKATAS